MEEVCCFKVEVQLLVFKAKAFKAAVITKEESIFLSKVEEK